VPGAFGEHAASTIAIARESAPVLTIAGSFCRDTPDGQEAGQKVAEIDSRFGALSAIFWDTARPAQLERHGHQNYPRSQIFSISKRSAFA
jgi:hypothetical protein